MTTKTLAAVGVSAYKNGYNNHGNPSTGVTFVNRGTIGVTSTQWGISIYGTGNTVANYGVVTTPDANGGIAAGVGFANANNVLYNHAGGTLGSAYEFGFYTANDSAARADNCTLINAGIIGGAPGHYAVDMTDSGIVTNLSTGSITQGIVFYNGYGSATATSAVSVVNSGQIIGISNPSYHYSAIMMRNGGAVTNLAGTISAGPGFYGIRFENKNLSTASTVTNAATIAGGSGGAAILFAAVAGNRVIDQSGGVFIGTVNGGSNATMELASTASAGVLTATSNQFTHFSGLYIDSGARWTIKGDSGLSSEFAKIGGFTVGNTISLTGLSQTPTTFASSVATVSGTVQTSVTIKAGSTGLETLTLLGSIASANLSFVAGATSTLTEVIPPPTVTEALVSDTGTSNSDKITNNDALTGGGDPNAVVSFNVNGSPIAGTATANAGGTWTFTPSPAFAQGSDTVVASETNAGGTGSASLTFTYDTVVPTVSSDNLVGSSPNNASSDQFTVTFSESVTGVDQSDFTATRSGTVADTSISVTPVNGSVYTVTVNGVTGDGTLRLDLNSSGTGIQDTAGNAISGGFTGGSTYTIDHTAPAVTESLVSDTGPSGSDKITSNDAVTGGGDAGAVVSFKEGVTSLGTATANGAGTWTFSNFSPALSQGSNTIVASETDAAGNTGSASLTFTLDSVAPVVTESLVSDTGSSGSDKNTSNDAVTGGGDGNAVVTIKEGGTTLGTTTANGSGTWTFSNYSPALSDGSHTIVASETDTAGNTGSASLTFTLDTTAPAVTEALVSDTGTSGSDKITSNDAVTGGGDGNAVVTIKEGGTTLGTTTANAGGTWTFSNYSPALSQGSNTIVASETDAAGNTGSASLTFTLDSVAPVVTESLVSDTGSSGSDKNTSNDAVTGGGDGNAVVTIKEGGTTLGTATANAGGTWTFSNYSPPLSDGSNTIVASETDTAGNTGSASLTFTLDTTAPAVTEALVSDTGSSGSDNITSNDAVTGGGDGNAVVTFKEGVTALGTATANAGGTWTFSNYSPALSQGSNTIVATETDAAGNSGSATLTFTLDTVAPTVSSINTVGSASNSGGTEQFAVTFSESVTGVDTSDFTLTDTGSVSGAINSISGSGSSYTVTVTGATGSGTMRLDLKSSGTGIADTAGNAISGGFTGGQGFTISAASGAPSTSAPATATIGVGQAGSVGTVTIAETPLTGGETFTLVVSDTAGVLAANTGAIGGGGTITPSNSNKTLTISGATLAQVNADLTTLTDSEPTTATDTVTYNLTDTNGGTATPASTTLTVNGLPTISAPGSATVTQNVATSPGTITVAETGNTTTSGETFTVVVSDGAGVLAANTGASGGGGTITPSNANKTLTISGATLAQVNADLTTLTDDDASLASDTITVHATDSFGNSDVTDGSIPVTVSAAANNTFNAHVYTDVNGDGVEDGGDTSLAGVTVNLLDGSGNPTGQSLTTNAGGNVSFTNLANGSYEIAVVPPSGDVVSEATNTFTPNTLSSGATASATEGVYAPATFSAHVYTDADGDGAQDGGETGLAGVTVDLLDGSGNPTGKSGTTDGNGNFSFTGLAPGSYEIEVVPGEVVVTQSTNLTTPNTLPSGGSATATEGVYVPATFNVHVYDDVNADGTQDAGDTNASGITVNLLDGSGNPTGRSTTTDSNGNASFTNVGPGGHEIAVVTPVGDTVSQSVNLNTSLTPASGGSVSATEGFYAAPALTQQTINLTDAEGQSLGNLWSELIANGVDPVPASLTISAVGTSGTQGTVSLNSGTDTLTYLATGFNPSMPVDSFTYTLKDGSGGTVTGTVDVTITGANLPTTVLTTTGGTATATGSGQRLISQGTGETLNGSPAGGDELFGGSDTTIVGAGSGNTIYVQPGNHTITMGANNNTLTLNDGNNTVVATGTGNTVTGGNGNDSISGMTGTATITLGNGNDTVSVSGAGNKITVGTGTDHITISGAGGNDTVIAGDGTNTISAGGANDSLTTGNGVSKITATGASATIVGGNGGDTVVASAAGDKITTGTGNDSITVTAGSATIKAGLGVNTIKFAGSGNDVVNQGGTDTLTDTGTNNTIALPLAGAGLDTINGSVLANGDTFDLRAAMAATTWDQQISDLGNYLSTGVSGSNALVQLSVTSGGTPITIAVLNGQGSVSLSSFVSHSLLT